MTSVFISYSSKDREIAEFIATKLGELYIDVFIDYQKLIGGDQFIERLAGEIEKRDFLVLLVSGDSLNSKWVAREVSHADRKGKRIIPVRLDMTEYPSMFSFTLGDIHYITFIERDKENFIKVIDDIADAIGLKKSIPVNYISHFSTRELKTLKSIGWLQSISFSLDGTLLASASGDRIEGDKSKYGFQLWDLNLDKPILTQNNYSYPAQEVLFSPDGISLAIAIGGEIIIWNTKQQREISRFSLSSPEASIGTLSYSKDGSFLAFSIFERKISPSVNVLRLDTNSIVLSVKGRRPVRFSPDNTNILFGSSTRTNEFNVLKWQSQDILKSFIVGRGAISAINYSNDGKKVVVSNNSNPSVIRIWDGENFRKIVDLKNYNRYVTSISFSSNDKLLATGSWDGVKVWDMEDISKSTNLNHRGQIEAVSFAPNKQILASASRNGTIKIWEITKNTERETY